MVQTAVGKDGGMPEKLKFESMFVDGQEVTVDGVKLLLRKATGDGESNLPNINGSVCEPVFLICEVDEDDWMKAIEKSISYIEWACDQLSYFSQFPVNIVYSELREKGNTKEKKVFPMPRQPAKFRKSVYMNVRVPPMIPLVPPPSHFSERDFAIMRWYHKSLSAAYNVDRFVFLWVCLEILCKASDFVVKAPYVNRCGHEIRECPICGETTEKEVNGKTLQGFLTNELKVEVSTAKKMWRFRQLLHGQNKLTEESTKDMESLIMSLQAAVNLGIKRKFGFRDDDFPIVLSEGVVSFSSLYLGLRTT